jgi:hypothetical protein
MPTPRRPGRQSPPQDKVTGRFDHGTAPDPAQEARAADTLAEIAALSRAPFRRILQRYADAAPSPEALATQAEKFPDRWAQGLAIAGRLAGYTEKLEIEGTVDVHHLHRLSDMELEAELHALELKLASLPPGPRRLPPGSPPPSP